MLYVFVCRVQIDHLLRSQKLDWEKQLMDLELGAGFLIAQFSASSLQGRRLSKDEKQLKSLLASPLLRGGLEEEIPNAPTEEGMFLKNMMAGEGAGAAFVSSVTAQAPIKRMFARILKEVCLHLLSRKN